MARIRPLEKDEVSDSTKTIYEEIEAVFGRVPNLFRTYAHSHLLIEANWNKPRP